MTATVLRSARAGRIVPTCCHEDPEMYPEFLPPGAPLAFACTADATVYLFHPAAPGEPAYYAGIAAFCDDHAAFEAPLERVAIADLPLVCAGCQAPVWLAHPEDHAVGTCTFYPPRCTGADHAPCCCPDEAAYLAAMGDAS